MFLEPYKSQPARRRRKRGFTLIELIVVVIIIGITSVIATPTIVTQLRERRSRETAILVSNLYSGARARAMGRGAAVMVIYQNGTFAVREAIEGAGAVARGQGACAMAPGRGCLTNNWANPDNWREVVSLVPDASTLLGVTVVPKRNTMPLTQMRVCFTPGGRSFASFDTPNNPTVAFTEAIEFEVQRPTGLMRRTILLPNGNARLAL